METLSREMMTGGLIGVKDRGVEGAGERTKDVGKATLKSLKKGRSFHDNSEEEVKGQRYIKGLRI